MERLRFLQAAAGATGLAGCVTAPRQGGCPGTASGSSRPPAGGAPADRGGAVDLPVSRSALVRGTIRDAIPAIVDPAFGPDWRAVGRELRPDDVVVGVVRDGRARAYPLATLSTHEVVNDEFRGPLLVTYCPLCATGLVAERTVRGEAAVFGVSGYLFRSNLVLYDRLTDSLWSQTLARAIRGDAVGSDLSLVPSSLVTWAAWRRAHPETAVMLPPPASGTIDSTLPSMPTNVHGEVGVVEVAPAFDDDRLAKGTLVHGVATAEAATAYPVERVRRAGVVNDCVGGLPVVVAGADLPRAFDRRVAGDVRRFRSAGPGRLAGGGSRWSATTGRALDGPHEGTALTPASGSATLFWFAWLDRHPETTVFGE